MQIEAVVVGPFEVNCWVVWGADRRAVIIDPGDDAAGILRCVDRSGLAIAGYALTHGHIDHVSALAALHRSRPAPVAMHPADAAWAFGEANQMLPYYSAPQAPSADVAALEDGVIWTAGGLSFRVMHTPGHTAGSICLLAEAGNAIFTGDTLFAGSIGRTDFPGGSPRAMRDSLRRLAVLPDGMAVHPGHGASTTVGAEKRSNFFLRPQPGLDRLERPG